jgi:hypothetical protein
MAYQYLGYMFATLPHRGSNRISPQVRSSSPYPDLDPGLDTATVSDLLAMLAAGECLSFSADIHLNVLKETYDHSCY